MEGRRFALVIGNSAYHDKNLSRLVTPDADVERLADVLRDPEIGGFDQVTPLINQPTTNVRRAIGRFFKNISRDDLLLLYFSGHGVRNDRGDLYLAVKDTEYDLLGATAISASFITSEMDASRSRRQILILDCCHSGAFAQGAKSAVGESVGTAAAFEGNGFGRVVLTATDATQFAWEGDQVVGQAENSVFTHYVIKGLQTGQADMDNDGLITVDELFDYAYEKVVSETPRQTPGKWTYKQQGGLVVAKNPNLIVRLVSLPEALQQAVESPLAGVRAGAVSELGKLLRGTNEGLALSAKNALERLANDDSRSVSIGAKRVLKSHAFSEHSPKGDTEKHAAPALADPKPTPTARQPVQKTPQFPPKEKQTPEGSGAINLTQPVPFWKSLPRWSWLASAGVIGIGLLLGIGWLANVIGGQFTGGEPTDSPTQMTAATDALTQMTVASDSSTQIITATEPQSPATPTETALPAMITNHGHEMALVPAGSFEMGFDADEALVICQTLSGPFADRECTIDFTDEEPVHSVYLDDYYIDLYEVTNEQYAACVADGGCTPPSSTHSFTRSSYFGATQYDNYPVIYVSWGEADTYCTWRDARLPTEAEWEKAARGPDSLTYPWGDTFSGKLNYCNLSCPHPWADRSFDDGSADTAPVGSYPEGVSSYGLYDMAGNVWEWVADWYDRGYYGAVEEGVENPAGPASGETRVVRGGSWSDNGSLTRTTHRGQIDPTDARDVVGFRCARSP